VCEFTMRDTLPTTYPHMLAFPLHMALITDPKFPFPAIGLVHIENSITQHRPVHVTEKLSLTVRATPLEAHAKGRKFSILTEARVGDELVWESCSTNLRRGGGSSDGADGDKKASGNGGEKAASPADELPAISEWRLPGDLGRQFAAVSGDRNPIHLYNITAKAFGFPRAIAHGMWTKSRCVAALDGRLPDKHTVAVRFQRPILLPAKVNFAADSKSDSVAFAVRDARKGTPHLVGSVTAG
ncbi:MAG: hypothetical protein JHC87_06480, partial [Thermoleophilaceae bacterium]|nr:hypothetical protein [Thermoleophilaceae bacterium]